MQAIITRAEPCSGSPCDGDTDALYCHPRTAIESRDLAALDAGDLRIEIARVGICGSDLGIMLTDGETGRITSTVPLSIPAAGIIPGHEGVGIVREIGAGVSGFSPGDWVALESLLSCGCCAPCRRGRFNQCLNASLVGFQRDGIFAELADLPAKLAVPIGTMATSEQGLRAATCIEPAACALVALQAAGCRAGENVLIFGAGPIGVFTAMLCRHVFGAARVDIVEPGEFRRTFARRWADRSWEVEGFHGGAGDHAYDLLVECSGELDNVERAIRRLAPNARVLLLARGTRPLYLNAVDHVITNGIALIGSRGHLGGAFDVIIRLWSEGRLPLEEAVTGVQCGLPAVEQALTQPGSVAAEHCKLQVRLC